MFKLSVKLSKYNDKLNKHFINFKKTLNYQKITIKSLVNKSLALEMNPLNMINVNLTISKN